MGSLELNPPIGCPPKKLLGAPPPPPPLPFIGAERVGREKGGARHFRFLPEGVWKRCEGRTETTGEPEKRRVGTREGISGTGAVEGVVGTGSGLLERDRGDEGTKGWEGRTYRVGERKRDLRRGESRGRPKGKQKYTHIHINTHRKQESNQRKQRLTDLTGGRREKGAEEGERRARGRWGERRRQ